MDKGSKWTVGTVIATGVVLAAIMVNGFGSVQPKTVVEKQVVIVTPTATPSASVVPFYKKGLVTPSKVVTIEPTAKPAVKK